MKVLPAYAGMIHEGHGVEGVESRAPRVCGDDPIILQNFRRLHRVLPAYAGMIPCAFGVM